jgi:hypothetical protein
MRIRNRIQLFTVPDQEPTSQNKMRIHADPDQKPCYFIPNQYYLRSLNVVPILAALAYHLQQQLELLCLEQQILLERDCYSI